MVARCANAQCSAEFRYLTQGRLFLIEGVTRSNETSADPGASGRRLQHYWLCDDCCRLFTVVREGGQARVVPFVSGIRGGGARMYGRAS